MKLLAAVIALAAGVAALRTSEDHELRIDE